MTAFRTPALAVSPIAEDVLQGLNATPKRLPPKLFYDAEGSRLFEQITELPEYYPTRTERSIFQNCAKEIVQQAGANLTLIELGAGSASKTRILIESLCQRQLRAEFYPVDVSVAALKAAVSSLNGDFPTLHVRPMVADYSKGLPQLASLAGRKLVILSLKRLFSSCNACITHSSRETLFCWVSIWSRALICSMLLITMPRA
jgi:uncharacterized SAM-dependent methyltransferase